LNAATCKTKQSQSYLLSAPSTGTGLGQGRCWKNNSPEDCCSETLSHSLPPFHRHLWIVVSVQDPFKAVSMATTILRTENLSDCGLGEGTTQAYSYMNFDIHT